jgi:acyl-CoA thioesterase YciA
MSNPDHPEPSDPDHPEPRRLDQWQLAIRVVAMPADTNAYGDIFGGWIMSQADVAGSTIAIEAAQGRVATVAVKEFRFITPCLVGDLAELHARMIGLGNTSITVEVDIWAQGEPDPQEPPPGRPRDLHLCGGRCAWASQAHPAAQLLPCLKTLTDSKGPAPGGAW